MCSQWPPVCGRRGGWLRHHASLWCERLETPQLRVTNVLLHGGAALGIDRLQENLPSSMATAHDLTPEGKAVASLVANRSPGLDQVVLRHHFRRFRCGSAFCIHPKPVDRRLGLRLGVQINGGLRMHHLLDRGCHGLRRQCVLPVWLRWWCGKLRMRQRWWRGVHHRGRLPNPALRRSCVMQHRVRLSHRQPRRGVGLEETLEAGTDGPELLHELLVQRAAWLHRRVRGQHLHHGLPHRQLGEHYSEGPAILWRLSGEASERLRGGVIWATLGARHLRAKVIGGQAEIDDAHLQPRRDQNVARVDIAMANPLRVHMPQTIHQLRRQDARLVGVWVGHPIAQLLAMDPLHRNADVWRTGHRHVGR
mmetsp:Transcript_14055/g.38410  ORF Transcript_14055/g.38410 Transcript_14055/m.38410 type:complete len:364 (-) Transcript_14055:506-1597(-)